MAFRIYLFVRIIVVIAAAILSLQILSWPWAALIVPGASPYVALMSALTTRRVDLLIVLALPLLLLALAKGRWFCRRLCPTGFILTVFGKLNRWNPALYKRVPSIGGWLVVVAIGTALAGYSWFLWMDPLVLFNGFFGVWRHLPWGWDDILSAAGFYLVIILTIFCPHVWCERCCPLGALQAFLGRGGRWVRRALFRLRIPSRMNQGLAVRPEHADAWRGMVTGRRAVLALLGGGGAAWLTRRVREGNTVWPLRPPGAVEENRFPGLCVRCGNCMNVCPQRILVPDLGQSGLEGLLTPVADFNRNYCDEWCHRCTLVCPTGAIRRMTLEEKRVLSLGNAWVDRNRCIAWSQQQSCMVCSEFCPYLAVRTHENRGIPCPEVNKALCRGCGACQNNCPARPLKAITVHGLAQHPVREHPMYGGGIGLTSSEVTDTV